MHTFYLILKIITSLATVVGPITGSVVYCKNLVSKARELAEVELKDKYIQEQCDHSGFVRELNYNEDEYLKVYTKLVQMPMFYSAIFICLSEIINILLWAN